MNNYSYICEYIATHKNWKNEFKELGIKFKISDNLAIFNYDINCDFSNKLIQEARGIIIDLKTLDVVCWPFRKFGNWNESYVDEIDWSSAIVQEKLDGSIIKCWYYNNKWNWSTNSVIDAIHANCNDNIGTFLDLIQLAVNYDTINFDKLNKDNTYIFELVSPENQIVIQYDTTMLYHIGTRSNITGKELNENIGIIKPKEYGRGKDLNSWLEKANNYDNSNIDLEGYVVVDKNYHRVKIKTPDYLKIHRIANNGYLSKERALDVILNNDIEAINILNRYPLNKVKLKYYEYQLEEVYYKIDNFISYVQGYYKEVNHNRKAVALAIKNHKFSYFGFKCLNNSLSAKELLSNLAITQIAKYIKEYQ